MSRSYQRSAFNEAARAAAIESHDLGQFTNDTRLDEAIRFAAALCETPISLISLVEAQRQRFLARMGIETTETPRATSFCAHAMHGLDIMVVPDTLADDRFRQNPLVTGEPHIRFYAGAPLVSEAGVPLGSLCVIDKEPRAQLTEVQTAGLKLIATYVMTILNDRKLAEENRQFHVAAEKTLSESERKFRLLADTMPQMVWSTRPDGYHDYYNARWYEFTGMREGSTDGDEWNGMFHPDDRERAWTMWRRSLETGEPYEIEYRLRNSDGQYRWTLGRALAMRDGQGNIVRWFGTCTDIHDQKSLLEQRELLTQELSHRIKNIFSVIGGLIGLSAKTYPELKTLAADLRARVMALGRAHDFVRPHSSQSRPSEAQTSFWGMLTSLLSAYQSPDSMRVRKSGADLSIDDRSATPLALLFHELATNAAKYGALSSEQGHVEISVALTDGHATIVWHERGGPEIPRVPAKVGFGSTLVKLSVDKQLGGAFKHEWLNSGLRATIVIPEAALSRNASKDALHS